MGTEIERTAGIPHRPAQDAVSEDELEAEAVADLPDREEMSVIQGIAPTPTVPTDDFWMPVDPAGPHQM
ncbi:MAG: hypothetical protein JOZ41_11110 [Chloroflexi bacterium]|nr:hypothetical protein [Chloroflexota bacterium]